MFPPQVPPSPAGMSEPIPISVCVLRALFAKLSGNDKLRLRVGMTELVASTDGQITLGTGCSGTDLIVAALQDTFVFWN